VTRTSSALFASAIVIGLTMAVSFEASAEAVTIYVGPGYPGYGGAPVYDDYPVDELKLTICLTPATVTPTTATLAQAMVMGTATAVHMSSYWGQGRRIARRVNRRPTLEPPGLLSPAFN
jgi:hypothetical protein